MKNSTDSTSASVKLYEILSSFTKDELKEFGKFLESPYFTNNLSAKKFFDALKPYHPRYDTAQISNEKIYAKIFPKRKFNQQILSNLRSEMLSLAEEFFYISSVRSDKLKKNISLLRALASKDLDKRFTKISRDSEKLLSEYKPQDNTYFFHKHTLIREHRNYFEEKTPVGKREKYYKDLYREIEYFTLYFCLKYLKYFCVARNSEKHLSFSFDMKLLEPILAWVSQFDKENIPDEHVNLIAFYKLALLARRSKSDMNELFDAAFYSLKNLVNKKINLFDKNDLVLIYSELNNYTKESFIFGRQEFGRVNFEITKEMIENDVYPRGFTNEEGKEFMTHHTYISLATSGMIVNEIDWAVNFVGKYKDNVNPATRDNAYFYLLGLIEFRQKNFESSLEYLSKVTIDDFYYYIRVKHNQLKNYYELGEDNMVISVSDTFKHYIATQKNIPDYISKRFLTFNNYLCRLITLRNKPDERKRDNLLSDLQAEEVFENKNWIIEKAKSIK